ncbi:hypothetical protein THII_1729 [Thioploca ingrica]|uniref:Abnormal spindle-like microcephaly-associated protein ASH domain-containing protein n=1 Tax=Thioploca ingrica TaxID=40754 RepID=A0A090BV07_9GAMM|nr:hypothetical protein THII_1729 [Thioploca ingrica]
MKSRIVQLTIVMLLLSLNVYGEEITYCIDGGLNDSQFCEDTVPQSEFTEGIAWEPVAIFDSVPKSGTSIDFGEIPVGSMAISGIMVVNNGNKKLEISKIKILGEHASDFSVSSVEPFAIPGDSDDYHLITVKCIPSDKGLHNAILQLDSNDLGNSAPSYQLFCGSEVSDVALDNSATEMATILGGNVIGSLGYGYSSVYQRFKPQSCFYGDVSEVGGGSSDINFNYIGSYEELSEYFNFKVSGEFKLDFFNVSGSSKYVSSHQETKLSRSLFFKYAVKLPNGQFNQRGLNNFGQNMLNLNDPAKFRRACGDYFVFQTERGARLILGFQFNFTREEHKKYFFANLGAGVLSIFSVKSAINKSSTEIKEKSSITLTAYQEGGSVENLIQVFGTNNNILTCAFENFNSCEKAIDNAINYAKTFSSNIRKSPSIIDYVFSSYEDTGVFIPPETVPLDIISTRQEIGHEYEKQYGDLSLAMQWIEKFEIYSDQVQTKERTYLLDIKKKLEDNLVYLRRAAITCFDYIDSTCLNEKKLIFKKYLQKYDRDWLQGIYLLGEGEYLDSKAFWFDFKFEHGSFGRNRCSSHSSQKCLPSNCEVHKDTVYPEGYEVIPVEEKRVTSKKFSVSKNCITIDARGCSGFASNGRYRGNIIIYGQCGKEKIMIPPIISP